MLGLPRLSRRLPTPLIAVAVASLLPIAFGWTQVRLLGELPRSFPMPTLPGVSWEEWNELVMAALTIFLLASIESLLSASVVESMAKQAHADNDQELVGQGLGNVASALFGGIPVTGVIARSATNIQSGARSRLSAILHALILLASMLFLGPIVTRIPLAALAGVLTAVALRMIEVRMLRVLWRGSRPEAVVFLVTSGAILATDLIDGVQIGLIATVLYFVYEMSNMKLRPILLAHESTADEQEAEVIHCPRVLLVHVEGPLFFASGFHMRNMMNLQNSYRCVILDLEGVSFLDVTGTQILDEEATLLHQQGIEVFLARPTEAVRQRLSTLAGDEFPAIQVCPIFETLTDAMRHADRAIERTASVRGVRRRYGVSPWSAPSGRMATPGRRASRPQGRQDQRSMWSYRSAWWGTLTPPMTNQNPGDRCWWAGVPPPHLRARAWSTRSQLAGAWARWDALRGGNPGFRRLARIHQQYPMRLDPHDENVHGRTKQVDMLEAPTATSSVPLPSL